MSTEWLPEGLAESDAILWGAALVGHPGEGTHVFSWLALGSTGVTRMEQTLTDLLDQRERLLAADSRWVASPRAPAVVWCPTPGVRVRQWALAERIAADGARLGVYAHPASEPRVFLGRGDPRRPGWPSSPPGLDVIW